MYQDKKSIDGAWVGVNVNTDVNIFSRVPLSASNINVQVDMKVWVVRGCGQNLLVGSSTLYVILYLDFNIISIYFPWQ